MEQNHNIETRINETLETARKIQQVEVSSSFTEGTLSKLRTYKEEENSLPKMGILRVAAVIALLVVNVYTIQYILGSKQDNTASNGTTTVKDLVNEYQTNDRTEVTFENNYIQ